MAHGVSGGLAAAIAGELPTGVSEDRKDPPRITCKWPCPTVLRVGARKAALKLQAKLAALEIVDLDQIEVDKRDEYESADKSEEGLCALHTVKMRDYFLGLGFERPPFLNKMVKKKDEDEDEEQPEPESQPEPEADLELESESEDP